MATVSKGRTFVSGETVTPAKLNELVDNATVTSIVDADVSASAAIALSKLATGALPTAITVASANIVDGTITAAKLDGAQTGSAPIYGCRAWVNFDGTAGSTVGGEFRCTIRASGNVSKVVRTAAGTFTIHFTTAMPDANFAVTMSRGNSSNGSYPVTGSFEVSTKTASTVEVFTLGFGNSWAALLTNSPENDVAIFR